VSLYDELNSLEDLQRLIDTDERESETLEYKRSSKPLQPVDRKELAKDISAFANSSGGLIVYGIATDPEDKTKPTHLEPILPANIDAIHLAQGAIEHPIVGIRTKTFPAKPDIPQALLLDIPASAIAPHQVITTHRYYHRQGVESVPMGHGLVELYFGRRTSAILRPIVVSNQSGGGHVHVHRTFSVTLGLLNVGGQIGRDVLTRIVYPSKGIVVKEAATLANMIGAPHRKGMGQNEISHIHKELYYPGVPIDFFSFTLSASREFAGREKPVLFLDVYAADTRPHRYNLFLT
jgi:hypothetical protein